MKTLSKYGVVGLALLVLAACSTGGAPGGRDWSRNYPKSLDTVWKAAIHTLDDLEYLVEDSDRERGRIRALSNASREFEEVRLDIRFVEREEEVRVDVQAGGGSARSGNAGFKRIENQVVEFLEELDAKLD